MARCQWSATCCGGASEQGNRAPRTPLPSPAHLHASAKPLRSTSRAARASALMPTSRSHEQCSRSPHAAHSQAEPQGCTDACHTFQELQGISEDAEGSQSATAIAPSHSHSAPPAANTPCASRPSPRLSAASGQRLSAAARAPREPVQTSQPLAASVRRCPTAAPRKRAACARPEELRPAMGTERMRDAPYQTVRAARHRFGELPLLCVTARVSRGKRDPRNERLSRCDSRRNPRASRAGPAVARRARAKAQRSFERAAEASAALGAFPSESLCAALCNPRGAARCSSVCVQRTFQTRRGARACVGGPGCLQPTTR